MKLELLIDEINKRGVLFNIHFCKAGVGFVMYDDDYTHIYDKNGNVKNWRQGLHVDKYYPTIRAAAEATLTRLKEKDGSDSITK